MLEEWDRHFTNRTWNVFRALSHVVPSHLMDPALMDFAGLRPTGRADADGDRAFDAEDFPLPAFSEDEIEHEMAPADHFEPIEATRLAGRDVDEQHSRPRVRRPDAR